MNTAVRDALVLENLPLVGYLVSDLCARADHLSREDLASVGTIGLIKAAEKYDATRGVPFGGYARRRIKGALLDELREQDIVSRTERQRIGNVKRIQQTLAETLGREPKTSEIAEAMGVDMATARGVLSAADRALSPLDVADLNSQWLREDRPTPEEEILAREQVHMVRRAVESLPERLRLVVEEIYFKGRSVGDVAGDLDLTYSSISHARIEAVRLLRDGLQAHYPDGDDQDAPVEIHSRGPAARRKEYLRALGERSQGGLARAGAMAQLEELAKAS